MLIKLKHMERGIRTKKKRKTRKHKWDGGFPKTLKTANKWQILSNRNALERTVVQVGI